MIVCLNLALDKPRHDIFYIPDDEILPIIELFFDGKYAKHDLSDEKLDLLNNKWEDIIDSMECDPGGLKLENLLSTLKDTWQYFIETIDEFGIRSKHIPLIGNMYIVTGYPHYLPNIKNGNITLTSMYCLACLIRWLTHGIAGIKVIFMMDIS